MNFLHGGHPRPPHAPVPQADGGLTLVSVHLSDLESIQDICDQVQALSLVAGTAIAQAVHIGTEALPAYWRSHPASVQLHDFDVGGKQWRALLGARQRVVITGWDARACVSQLLQPIVAELPITPAEVYVPLGPLDDAKLANADTHEERQVLLTTLMGLYARKIADVRGSVDLVLDGRPVARHGDDSGAPTALHISTSLEHFVAAARMLPAQTA